MNTEIKFCIDCRHYCPGDRPDYAKCAFTTKGVMSLVDGSIATEATYCSTERRGYLSTDCGPDAKHFEPKAP